MPAPFISRLTIVLALALVAACSDPDASLAPAGEARGPVRAAARSEAMVVTANPHATRAGEAILRAGGSAVDAAVAIEAMLSLVEPQSSGFGGGGFMTYYDRASRSVVVYDGRETAPAGATPELFVDPEGEVYGFIEAKNSGLSVGVPGVVAMLALAHEEHGALPWNALFEDAVRLATEGFDVSPRLRSFFEKYGTRLIPATAEEGPLDAYRYFFDASGTLRERLVNADYAATLRAIGDDPRNLYTGELAAQIVAAVRHAPRVGTLSLDDLAAYRPRRLDPLCVSYRDLEVCGPPPPSSWVAVGMILGLLEALPFAADDRRAGWVALIEAQRLAYADRDHYVADDTRVPVPLGGMLNRDYLARRAAGVDVNRAATTVTYGDPWAYDPASSAAVLGGDTTEDYAGTTHFVVVDYDGNVVSMTASVESIFGSARMAGGMFLNNQLTDFARDPRDGNGLLVANHPAPGKRPRSSMSPTIAVDSDGQFRLATGSPGGNSIIAYTAKTLLAMIDWNLSPQEAVDLPNVVARGNTVRIESERADPAMIEAMRAHGFEVRESDGENSGLSVVWRHDDGRLEGGVDPRREGTIARLICESSCLQSFNRDDLSEH